MRIKEVRESISMTQKELAERSRITPAYLCDLENGKRCNPSIQVLVRIAEALRVPINELIERRAG